MMQTRRLADVRTQIRTSDLLLYRRPASLIARTGRGVYSHAAKVSWWHGGVAPLLCVCEVREWVGGRITSLASQVNRYPGLIDVYRPATCDIHGRTYNASGADYFMRCLVLNTRYGWWNIFRASLSHVVGVRLVVEPCLDDSYRDHHPPFCSQACVMADRIGGGFDAVPNLADRHVDPNDLSRSPFYEPLFTLTP